MNERRYTSSGTGSRKARRFLALGAISCLPLVACSDDGSDGGGSSTESPTETPAADSVIAVDPTTRQPAAGQTRAAVYVELKNGFDTELTITGVTSPITDNAQIHETIENDDGTMQMRQVDSFTVPADGTFTFESGGAHIMLMDIDPDAYPTDVVEVTIEFAEADPLTFNAVVESLTGESTGESTDDSMGDMDMDDMDMGD